MSDPSASRVLGDESRADPRLQALLELWDGMDEEGGQPNTLGITLLVGGVTYSGLLIAGRVWSRSMSDLLHGVPDNQQVRALGNLFEQITESGDATDTRGYVHLANVAVGLPSDGKRTSLLMRIRAADVSAWTVGTIGELAPFPAPPGTGPGAAGPA